jgi:sugar lactone lactonase YvrE
MMIKHWSSIITSGVVTLLALGSAALRAEDYAITTFAGATFPGSADGTQGTSPGPTFNNPYGVGIDSAKNVYVADTLNNTIRKITPARVVSTLAGSAGNLGTTDGTGAAARFNFPTSVAADSAGNLYVTDFGSNTIRKISPAGVVTTFAGVALQIGSANGTGSAARFFQPAGVAVDSAGNLYVADSGNHLIRKIGPDGTVSTLAGGAQSSGTANGTGGAARFNKPWGIAVDGAGNVYVADSDNHAIRKITPAGVVTTLAGLAGSSGSVDGPAANARFNQPRGVTVDAAGNVFVADYANATIRVINAAGIVSTVAGSPGLNGSTDSVGLAARFFDPSGIVADGNVIYVADSTNNEIRRGVPASAAALPTITVQPLEQEVSVGQSFTLRVVATGSGLTYQWLGNGGVEIPGATNSTLNVTSLQESTQFSVRITATGGGTINSQPANVVVLPVGAGPIQITARPLSQQVDVGQPATFSVTATGTNLVYQWLKNGTAIAGATNASLAIASAQGGDAATYTVRITSGTTVETATAKLIVGANAGPAFTINQQPLSRTVFVGEPATFFVGVSGSASASVTYQWFKNDVLIANANAATFSIQAAQASDTGLYRVRVSGPGGPVDSDPAALTVASEPPPPPPPATFSRLSNLSILTSVATAGDNFTLGYVVNGASTSDLKPILIRAAGPSLVPLGVGGVLADPKLDLFVGTTQVGGNDNWGGTAALTAAFTAVGAFAYVNATSLDAAVLANISSRDNSVRVSAAGTGTGAVIAELYDSTPLANMNATTPRLVNVSVLKHLGTGLTAGFVIDGNTSKKVLIRCVGPTIGVAPFNVAGAVADPQLTLFTGQTVIGSNDNWGGTADLSAAFTSVGAFALPATSRDAAIVATLNPGSYTVQASGVGNTTGVAIVEVYEMP